MRRTVDVHPVLFGVFPVLFAAAHNRNVLVLDGAVFLYALVGTGAAALALRWVLRRVLKNPLRAGLCASLILLSVSSYGMVDGWVFPPPTEATIDLPRHIPLVLWVAALAGLCYFATLIPGDLRRPTHFANTVACLLAASAGLQLALAARPAHGQSGLLPQLREALRQARPEGPQPDIYYIIVDRYGSEAALRESLHVDNREFIGYLRRTGFYVADGSHANYGFTVLSLASALHLGYLDGKALAKGRDPKDLHPVFDMLQDYPVWRFLRERGYKFVHIGAWYDPVRRNTHADINLVWGSRLSTEFTRLLWDETLPAAFAREAGLGEDPADAGLLDVLLEQCGLEGLRKAAYSYAPYQCEQLVRLSRVRGPKFVTAHLMVTHPPYVFGQEGSFLSYRQVKRMGEARSYSESLEFCNRKLKEVIPRLLSGSRVPPIILLQADEGPYPERVGDEEGHGLGPHPTGAELRLKYGILNAYYVPPAMRRRLYPTITPVNSFRLLLSACFGADLPLLPDRCYAHEDRRLDTLRPVDARSLRQPGSQGDKVTR